MRQTQKQKLLAEKAILADKLNTILEKIGIEQMYQFIINDLDESIEYLDLQIEEELDFAKENRSGAYRSAGTEARQRAKYLKTVKNKQKQVLKMFQDFLKMKKKVDTL